MNLTLLFLIGCFIIACVVIYESYLLKKVQGHVTQAKALPIISFIEFIWLVVCVVALYQLTFTNFTKVVPILYIIENAVGWIYGIYLMNKSGVLEQLEHDKDPDFIIPSKYTDFILSFAIVFALISVVAALITWRPTLLNTLPF